MLTNLSGNAPDGENEKARKAMRYAMGPHAIDQMIRQAVSTCWMMLPDERKNAQELKTQLQRLLDRAIANFQEDANALGFDSPPPK